MMNKIYDFYDIQEARSRQNKLILSYIIYVVCFVCLVVLTLLFVDNNASISIFFALLLFVFVLFSVAFWRIKYGILNKYRIFLDNMESGKREEFIGIFKEKICASDDKEQFDRYIFEISNKRTEFLVYRQCSLELSVGRKYHFESVGNYVYQWENID